MQSLEELDHWPEVVKDAQRGWIGRSSGTKIKFLLSNGEAVTVFTTRAETIFGVSFLAVSHENIEALSQLLKADP